jgi:hypothetical protein
VSARQLAARQPIAGHWAICRRPQLALRFQPIIQIVPMSATAILPESERTIHDLLFVHEGQLMPLEVFEPVAGSAWWRA